MSQAIFFIVIPAYIGSACGLLCCRLDKKVPINYILLSIFTVCVSIMVGVACVRTDPKVVLEAALLTTAVVVAITLFACTTKQDFTIFGPICWIIGMVFCTAGILAAIFGFHLGLLWSVIGVILFSFYLLFDTQMIMGGD